MKNHVIMFAMVAAAILTGPRSTEAGVGEAAAIFPVTIPAKSGGVPGVKFVGIPVARPSLYEGTVTTAVISNSTTSTATNPAFTTAIADTSFTTARIGNPTVQTNGLADNNIPTADDNFVLEITSGPMVGLTKPIVAVANGSITVQGGFSLNLDVNTKFVVRKDWTLGTLFGNAAADIAAAGVTGGLSSTADNLGVIKNDILNLYYWTGSAWRPTRNFTNGVTYQHLRLPLSGGIYVKRNAGTTGTLYLSGIYRPTRLQALLEGADNSVFAVTTPNFKDITLAETGLHRYVRSNPLNSSCDEVRVVDSTGVVKSYVNSAASSTATNAAYTGNFWTGLTTNAPSWKATRGSAGAGSANGIVIPAGSAVLIKKETASPRLIGLDPSYQQ